jgi:hydroxypyruvate reductase
MNNREIAQADMMEGIKGVLPGKLITDLVSVRGSVLKTGYCSYDLTKLDRIFVIGAGKASAAMAITRIGNRSRITGGYIVTKYGFSVQVKIYYCGRSRSSGA